MSLPQSGKAALFVEPNQPFQLKEYPLTQPQKGEALLKISASGVCGTDVHIWKGRLPQNTPLVIGHEFLGEVIALPEDGCDCALKVGDQVIYVAAIPCGKCLLVPHRRLGQLCGLPAVSFARDPEHRPTSSAALPSTAMLLWAILSSCRRVWIPWPSPLSPVPALPTSTLSSWAASFKTVTRRWIPLLSRGWDRWDCLLSCGLASQGVRNVIAVVRGTSPIRMEYAQGLRSHRSGHHR